MRWKRSSCRGRHPTSDPDATAGKEAASRAVLWMGHHIDPWICQLAYLLHLDRIETNRLEPARRLGIAAKPRLVDFPRSASNSAEWIIGSKGAAALALAGSAGRSEFELRKAATAARASRLTQ